MKNPDTSACDMLQSKVISFLRFPLIVAIVLIHTHVIGKDGHNFMYDASFPIFSNISYLISRVISGSMAIPCFFFISGFLFFYNKDYFNISIYKDKLERRLHSLFIPYILWNFLTLILYFSVKIINPDLVGGKYSLPDEFSFSTFISIFWNVNGIGYPICGPLWFIRNLIILNLITPLIYLFAKYTKSLGAIFLTINYVYTLVGVNLVGFTYEGLYFFYLGAFFSIQKKNFLTFFEKISIPAFLLLIVCTGIIMIYHSKNPIVIKMNILVGLVSIMNLSKLLIKKYDVTIKPIFVSSTFFLYAYHYFFIIFLSKVLVNWIVPKSELALITIYVMLPFCTITFGIFMYSILKKYFPKITAIMTGGRI